jgi:mono/diheme cytochrome c family protein
MNGHKARRADLIRTMREGLDGTSMPSFGLLKEQELEDLASYVIHLSLRGDVEFQAMLKSLNEGTDLSAEDLATNMKEEDGIANAMAKRWTAAQDPKFEIVPESAPPPASELKASVLRGHTLFTTGAASCISCHIDYGRQAAYFYDAWGNVGRPLDLTVGVYHGGRRPIDLYYRIMGGVPPSNMPQVGRQTKDDQTGLKSEEIWDVVNFLRVLPYPAQRNEMLTGKDRIE